MTAADTATAEAAVTGITDEELSALQAGGWGDTDANTPGWRREVKRGRRGRRQRIFPVIGGGGHAFVWNAESRRSDSEYEHVWLNSLDEALVWCDERVGGREPAKAGSATEQEDRFARLAAAAS